MSLADVLDLLACPVCGAALTFDQTGAGVRCPVGHQFDVGKPGYLNLSGRARPPNADTAVMVAARERFLGAGHFAPIADQLVASTPDGDEMRVLDCGAGPGHYLERLLTERPHARGVALDVSVPAAKRAARRRGRLGAVVADVWSALPVATAGIDLLLSVFAPRHPAEFARVLAPSGRLVTVTPRPEHLIELRTSLGLLAVDPDKDSRLAAQLGETFVRARRQEVAYGLALDETAVRDLVEMGPNAYHLPDAWPERFGRLAWPASVSVAVEVTKWIRRR